MIVFCVRSRQIRFSTINNELLEVGRRLPVSHLRKRLPQFMSASQVRKLKIRRKHTRYSLL